MKKGVGINPAGLPHYVDHLAPVCVMMGIPLIFVDELAEAGRRYYPELQLIEVNYQDLTPEYLISNYDLLFLSDLWDRDDFRNKYAPLEKKYGKRFRHVHCPHGFSDKGFYLSKCAREEITLIYGENMLDLLRSCNVFEELNSYVITGNYRYTYFKKHQQFYEKIVKEEVLSKFDRQQSIILYAPTWLDFEQSTTFFDVSDQLLSRLPADYNMIVKLHPRLELDDVAQYYKILGKYEDKGNILFLRDFPPVYPLLAHTDIYIGDLSSIGYDFLIFNKPMYFLNKEKRDSRTDRRLYLFRAGVEVMPEDYGTIYQTIEKTLPKDAERYSSVRKQLYDYTFGNERPYSQIKQEIMQASL